MPPVPVVEAVRVTESVPRPNRSGPLLLRGRDGFGPEAPAAQDLLEVPRHRVLAQAGRWRRRSPAGIPSAGETDVETTTVPSGKRKDIRRVPVHHFALGDAGAGKGALMRGAGGEGTGSPVGVALTGGRTSRPAGAAAGLPADRRVASAAVPSPAPAGGRRIRRAWTGTGAAVRRAAARRRRGAATPGLVRLVIWSSTTAAPPRSTARQTPAMTSRLAFIGCPRPRTTGIRLRPWL